MAKDTTLEQKNPSSLMVVKKKQEQGARNLTLLGVGAILIAIVATSLELWIYRETGDIYLDRSRPGFLPDAEEVEEDTEADSGYIYPENGALDASELDDYLRELRKVEESLNKIQNPYGSNALSNESLGIEAAKEQE